MKNYYVYIMMSISGVLYIGMTNNLERRVLEHKSGEVKGFTQKYKCYKLVYFEETINVLDAIEREKTLKKWNRIKKETLIKTMNPDFRDLFIDFKI